MRIRMALALVLLSAAALAGCGSGAGTGEVATAGGTANPTSSAGTGKADEREAIFKYAQCMRDNGVTNFKDPEVGSDGEYRIELNGDGLDPKTVDAAQEKCKQLLPNGGEPQAIPAERLEQLRRYSQCMRDNGLPKFPDPTDQGLALNGNDFPPDDPKMKAAEEKCRNLMPAPPSGEKSGLTSGSGR